jgi:hypothetical protein
MPFRDRQMLADQQQHLRTSSAFKLSAARQSRPRRRSAEHRLTSVGGKPALIEALVDEGTASSRSSRTSPT